MAHENWVSWDYIINLLHKIYIYGSKKTHECFELGYIIKLLIGDSHLLIRNSHALNLATESHYYLENQISGPNILKWGYIIKLILKSHLFTRCYHKHDQVFAHI